MTFLLSNPANILFSAFILRVRTFPGFPFHLSRARIKKYLDVVQDDVCRRGQKQPQLPMLLAKRKHGFPILSDCTKKLNRIHLNAFSGNPKFCHAAISGRYLINPSNAFCDGFYPSRELFSGKLRYGCDSYRSADGNMESLRKRCGNTELLHKHGIVIEPK